MKNASTTLCLAALLGSSACATAPAHTRPDGSSVCTVQRADAIFPTKVEVVDDAAVAEGKKIAVIGQNGVIRSGAPLGDVAAFDGEALRVFRDLGDTVSQPIVDDKTVSFTGIYPRQYEATTKCTRDELALGAYAIRVLEDDVERRSSDDMRNAAARAAREGAYVPN